MSRRWFMKLLACLPFIGRRFADDWRNSMVCRIRKAIDDHCTDGRTVNVIEVGESDYWKFIDDLNDGGRYIIPHSGGIQFDGVVVRPREWLRDGEWVIT